MNIQEALTALGYREARPGRWAKPVGYHLFTFHIELQEWANWYKGMDGKIAAYDRRTVSPDPNPHDAPVSADQLLTHLTMLEAYTRINVGDGSAEFYLAGLYLDLVSLV